MLDRLLAALDPLPHRSLVALVGPPASGKSTLSEAAAEARPDIGVLAQDGFHLDDRLLVPRGLRPRKGAPHTFDVAGLAAMLARLRDQTGPEILVPVFDRSLEIARAAAAAIPAASRVVLVEGNWLLLDQPGWRDLRFDLTVRLEVPEPVLRARLEARWAELPPQERRQKIEENDLPNARLVAEASRPADLVLSLPG